MANLMVILMVASMVYGQFHSQCNGYLMAYGKFNG